MPSFAMNWIEGGDILRGSMDNSTVMTWGVWIIIFWIIWIAYLVMKKADYRFNWR